MKKLKNSTVFIFAFVAMLSSSINAQCNPFTDISVSPSVINAPPEGGTYLVSLSYNNGCFGGNVSMQGGASWLTNNFQTSNTIQIVISPTTVARNTNITLNYQQSQGTVVFGGINISQTCTEQTYYLDADNDGYHAGTQSSCASPGTGWTTTVKQPGDCNDGNAALNPTTVWYLDADNDNFHAGTQTQCSSPGTGWTTVSRPAGDCNDNNAGINPNTTWYLDADNDGFYPTGGTQTQCSSPGTGWTTTSKTAGDCNDGDGTINPNTIWYLDADSDGFYPTGGTQSSCTSPGAGYSTTLKQPDDCNDGDPELNPNTIWYADNDLDGYADEGAATVQQCNAPAGNWTLNSELNPCGVSAAEKQALLDLYNATNGDNWVNTLAGSQPWDTNIPVCDWFGVFVNTGGKVTGLNLTGNGLVGTINTSLVNLADLTSLYLQNNQLVGSIPVELASLSNLTVLDLALNQFTGTIPLELGNLSNLSSLVLSSNQLTGSIPSELGNLTNLYDLSLHSNSLTGTIPSTLGQLVNLGFLQLRNNQLSGPIPSSIGNLIELQELILNNNLISGTIPSELGFLTNLQNLRLNNNQFFGAIPNSLLNLENLQFLYLNNNGLSQPIPDFTIIFIDEIHFNDNVFAFADFEGQHNSYLNDTSAYTFAPQAKVDAELSLSVNEAEDITLTSNKLVSPNNSYQWFKDGVAIPGATTKDYEITSATPADAGVYYFEATNSVVTGLTLTRNNITLTIDPPINSCGVSEAEKQALIDLYNATDGPNWTNSWDIVNTEPCDWYGVTVSNDLVTQLYLADNNLIGSLPQSISDLSNVIWLNLFDNELSGNIPTELYQMSNLEILVLAKNQFAGTISPSIGNLTSLWRLDMSSNQFSGTIPTAIGNLSLMRELLITNNALTGDLPDELYQLTALTILQLEDNQLTGGLSNQISNLTSLYRLYLYNNQLSGPIPLEFSGLLAITDVLLANNNFSGTFPPISSLTNLIRLGLDNNQFSGDFPDLTVLPNFTQLSILGNGFVFNDFETEHVSYTANLSFYGYTPQTNVDIEEPLSVNENESITLTSVDLTSTNNSYQWFKDGVAIAGATTKDYEISNATPADAGIYYFEATNSVVTGLTLTRNNITLTIDPPIDTCGVSETEKQALLDLYNATNGDNWVNTLATNQPWDTNIPVCDWFGVTVVNENVTAIQLGNNDLSGSIPASISNLTELVTLRLHSNSLNGNIPASIGGLSKLQTLYCRLNQLSGPLPSELGNISTLRILDFSGNNLTGSLPLELGNLSNLRGLELNSNQFTGMIPTSLGNLSSLLELKLGTNQLSGSIPSELGNLTVLQQLNLSGNQLTGTIPTTLGAVGNALDDFQASNNQLTGGIPVALGNLVNLRFLRLNNNQLTGAIPSELESLQNLEWLSLSTNNLSGAIPQELGNLTSLLGFQVTTNQLSGGIPNSFANLSNLRDLFVSDNVLTGPIPDLTGLTNLINLSFLSNSFVFSNFESQHAAYLANITNIYQFSPQDKVDLEETQSVPENESIILSSLALTSPNNSYQWFKDGVAIPGATTKEYEITNATTADAGIYYFEATNSVVTGLTLTRNNIILTIDPPIDTCGVSETEKQALLDLYNSTNGDNWTNTLASNQPWDTNIPVCDWFGVTVVDGKVTRLTLNNNQLSGTITSSFSQLSNLERIAFHINSLQGNLPAELFSLPLLERINLNSNDFTGTFPTGFGALSNLQVLQITNNQLSGPIASDLGALTNLLTLELSNNSLTGPIPVELGNLSSLTTLRLQSNLLDGEIPNEFGNLSNLNFMQLNDNQLEGDIPIELGSLTNLFQLFLSQNRFTGSIPDELGSLTNLNTLQLNNNFLEGSIPSTLSNLSNVKSLRFDNNLLHGAIPLDLTSLGEIDFLSINNNEYVFSDLEGDFSNYQTNLITYNYSPQAKVDLEETQVVPENESITLTSTALTSPNNSYQWFKDGVAIPGATAKEYEIANATPADAGVYYFEATNSVVTGLTLTRNDITLTIDPPIDTCGVSELEKLALLEFYDSTIGDNWVNTLACDQPWNTNIPVCDWFGVTVVDGKVTELEILNNNLVGSIPESIGNLIFLERLRLVNENWGGSSLPITIGNLTALTYLQIAGGSNGLGGTIPSEIGNLTNLISLNISLNDLSGPIPSTIGNLTNLVDFYAHSNNLESLPNTIGNMASLVNIYLQGNNISGSIPPEIGQLSNLLRLLLASNNIEGSIPPEIGDLSNLIWLHLQDNQLEGELPSELGDLTNLGVFYVYQNNLLGGIPSSYGNWDILRTVGLQENSFTGPLPLEWSSLSSLTRLSFDTNNFIFSDFENAHPNYVANATALYEYFPQGKVDEVQALEVPEGEEIILTSTVLTSTNNTYQWFKDGVPIDGATSKDLIINPAAQTDAGVYYFEATNSIVDGLTLTRNEITLTIGPPLCGVSEAEKQALLDLYFATDGPNWVNSLNWNTAVSVCEWFGVTVENGTVTALELPNNTLVGPLPESIGNLLNITLLDLSDNSINGELPPNLGSLLELDILLLPNNDLTGELPPTLGSLSNLTTMDLSGNELQSEIPISFCNLTSLTDLNLSNNQLFGSIPVQVQLMVSLERLNLSFNELDGNIPSVLTQLPNLQELAIENNQFEGTIPFNAVNNNLTSLTFQNNNFLFKNFEANHNYFLSNLTTYIFSPQSKTDTIETRSVTLGNSITLTTEMSSSNNTYQWFKDGNEITDATGRELVIENVSNADETNYHVTALNSTVTGLELTRNTITLIVVESCDVPIEQRQALIAFYNATDGPNWTNTLQSQQPWGVNDPNSLVCDWYGITVNNNNVEQIELPNNGLSGVIPDIFDGLPALSDFYAPSNSLSGSISGIFSVCCGLQLENNFYIFEDFESDFDQINDLLGFGGFIYSPQAKVDIEETLNVETGGTITLTSNQLSSANNSYQWFKNGLPIDGETSKDLVLTNVSSADEAGYHFEATNGIVTGLTLEREMIMLKVNSGPDACGVSDLERQTLIELYTSLDGINWTNNTNWNTDAPVCDWFGVATDVNANVIGITLPNNGLRGEIPATISQLANLEQIDFSQNNVIGELPAELGELSSLQSLLLNDNILVGEMPEELGNLSLLTELNLANNRISGPVPSTIGGMQNLQYLDLNDNKLNQSIPAGLSTISTLVRFNVSNNQMTGGISDAIGDLQLLEEFWLANNNFSGNVPVSISTIPTLFSVLLNNNNFNGDIPVLIPDLTIPGAEIAIENNGFVFSDFEDEYPDYSTLGNNFTYDPQDLVDIRQTIPVLENASVILGTVDLTSPNNTYVWYKDGVVIPNENGPSYTIANFDPSQDAVDYWFVATNSTIPVLELTRRRITLVEQVIVPLQDLVLVALCSDNPGIVREWEVQNPNSQNIIVTWQVLSTSQTGSLTASPGTNLFTTSTEIGANTVQIAWQDSDGTERNTQTLSNSDFCTPQTECLNVMEGVADGSFETATASSSQSRNASLDAFGWVVSQGTPDTFSAPFSNGGDPYLRSDFMNSPDGGNCVGALRVGNTAEAFSTSLTGLTQGATYVIEFYQANATNLLDARLVDETYGSWEVGIGSEILNSKALASNSGNARWERSLLEFTASSVQAALEFKAYSTAANASQSYPVYMLIDGIRIYQKPADSFTTACYEIATQVFCNTDDDNPPTIADLSPPQGTNVLWYSDPVGGTRYFASDELFQIPSILWADDGSGTRTSLEVIFDLGAPEGLEYQSFDLNVNPTLADLVVEGTNITWHSSFSSAVELPLSTTLVDEEVYYAAQNGNICRIPISVNIGVPELNGDGFQEFCSSNAPTISDLVMNPTNVSYSIVWYSASIGGAVLNATDALVDNTTYYATQTDGAATGEDRFPVRVSVIDVEGQTKIYEQDVLFATNSTVADISDYYNLDENLQWYTEAFGGTAYFNSTNLEEGSTYYARIGEGLCAGLKVLAITVDLDDIVEPELISCVKFVPQPGREYVISGWVREETLTAQSAGFIDFNLDDSAKEAVLALFNALTKTIVEDALEIPEQFVVKKLFPEVDMTAVLPYLRDYTGNNVTVFDFRFEKENIEGLERSVGYSFALDPAGTNRMEFRTPEIALSFNQFTEDGSLEFQRGFHFPLRNSDNLEVIHNSVSILSGNRFRINSNFELTLDEDSNLKDRYLGYNTDGTSDSGIEESTEIFDYLENPGYEAMNYEQTSIELEYKDEAGNIITDDVPLEDRLFTPKGAVIDGWQRISSVFPLPANAAYMRINLKTNLDGVNAYFDDVRMLPIDSNMKSFVYDPITQRLQAELDENNYATFYEYDTEGGLVRVKKETERGIYTIQETRSGNSKLNSGQ